MADEGQSTAQREVIHLPGPSLIPMATAIGLTVAVIGLIVSWTITAIGAVILFASLVRWISDVRRDVRNLPE